MLRRIGIQESLDSIEKYDEDICAMIGNVDPDKVTGLSRFIEEKRRIVPTENGGDLSSDNTIVER
jgi:hypothetical protein